MDIAAAHAAGGTNWDGLTAIGTIALAVVTAVALGATILITRQDRTRAAGQLKDERAAADARLDRQLKASDKQLARQLEHSEVQLRDAREHARCEQQEADAWAVEVSFSSQMTSRDLSVKLLGASVRNRSARTVKWLDCGFSPDGKSVVQARSMSYLPGGAWDALTDMSGYEKSLVPGTGVEFDSDPVPVALATAPYPVVQWTDMQNQRWEHKRGQVRRISAMSRWVRS